MNECSLLQQHHASAWCAYTKKHSAPVFLLWVLSCVTHSSISRLVLALELLVLWKDWLKLTAELVKEGEGVQHKVCDSLNSISCIVLKTCTNECTVGGNLLLFTESDWFSTGHLQLEMNSAAITDVSV